MTLTPVSNIITWNELTRMLGVEPLEVRAERIWERVADQDYSYLEDDAEEHLSDEATDEDIRTAREEARDRAVEDECCRCDRQYRDAVRSVAEELFREHRLILTETEEDGKESYFQIEPEVPGREGWCGAADKLIQTINGVGMFGFDSVQELVDSGPYCTIQDAVMQHIHWIADHPRVYEGSTARWMVERKLRY